jgi:splicing suppressor protein 51
MLGARAESMVPPHVWLQLSHLFPSPVALHIIFIGPEVIFTSEPQPSDTSFYGVPSRTKVVSEHLTLTTLQSPYEELHEALGPFDPYIDVFFAFSPGFGFPSSPTDPTPQAATNWHKAITQILDTKCALFCSGFGPEDVERDVLAIDKIEGIKDEFEWVLTPGENPFGSAKWEIAEFDPRVAAQANWGVWGIRGKRYEVSDRAEARITLS